MSNAPRRAAVVLLVEDNEGDIRLTREAFRELNIEIQLHVVRDGVEAMAFFRREPPYADAPRPDVVLLDLNLPRKSGHEVLHEVKGNDALKQIPVVVLTTSGIEELKRCEANADYYVTKPSEYSAFIEIVQQIQADWLSGPRSADW